MSAPMKPPTTDQLRATWDRVADGFDRFVTAQTITLADQLLDRAEIGPGVRVLDVGAGSGALTLPAARKGADVVAVDIAPTMLERLEARIEQEGLSGIEARLGDAQDLDLDDDSFDIAVSLNGVTMVPDLAGALQELARVTRPGGRVIVGAFSPPPDTEFIGWFMRALQVTVQGFTPPSPDSLPPFRLADPDRFALALTAAGLKDVQVDTAAWEVEFDSAQHLWDMVVHSNPIAVQLTAGLDDDQVSEVQRVLDGMLRERSGGAPSAVLHGATNIGTGIA